MPIQFFLLGFLLGGLYWLCLLPFSHCQVVTSTQPFTYISTNIPNSFGQDTAWNQPFYVNRYQTMSLPFWNLEKDQHSPLLLDTASFPDRCPGGDYPQTQPMTFVDILPDVALMACVPSVVPGAVQPAGIDPTTAVGAEGSLGPTQATLDFAGAATTPQCKQRRLSSIAREGSYMLRNWSGTQVLVMKPCDRFTVTYTNKLNLPDLYGFVLNEPEIVHAHGMTPPYYLDGAPFMQINPQTPSLGQTIPVGGHVVFDYINPNYQSSGTYFIHSHYGTHHDDGVGMGLMLVGPPPLPQVVNGQTISYPDVEYNKLKFIDDFDVTNDYNGTYDVVMYFEDFCPISYNEGAPPASSTCAPAKNAFYALYTEWLQSATVFNSGECQPMGSGMDIDYTNHLCNNRSAESAYAQLVIPGSTYHLRIVNSAGMTNYFVTFDGLQGTVIALDGQWIVPKNVSYYWVAVAQRLDILVTIPSGPSDEGYNTNGIYRMMGYAEGTMLQAGVLLYTDPASPPPFAYVTLGPQYDFNFNYIPGTGARWYQDSYIVPADSRNVAGVLDDLPPGYPSGLPWMDPNFFSGMAGDMGLYDNVMLESHTTSWYGLPTRTEEQGEYDLFYEIDITGNNGFKVFNLVSFQLPPNIDGSLMTYAQTPTNPNGQQFVNGVQQPPLAPHPVYVYLGARVCVHWISHNTDAHAIHLHGHTFQVTEHDGIKLGNYTHGYGGSRRDVLLTPRGQCREMTFCFDANNAEQGVHPLHCHMSYHLAAGMLTTVNYVPQAEISTYYNQQIESIAAEAQTYLDTPVPVLAAAHPNTHISITFLTALVVLALGTMRIILQ